MSPNSAQRVSWSENKTGTEGRPQEDTGEAGGSCTLRKATADTSPVDTLNSSLHIREEVRLCPVSHPVCGILFLQPLQTDLYSH